MVPFSTLHFTSIFPPTRFAALLLLMMGFALPSWGQPATGGTETDITVGGETFRVHTFGVGSSSLSVPSLIAGMDVLIVAGGGGGGTDNYIGDSPGRGSGGGGAGGYLYFTGQFAPVGTYAVTVGAGGAGATGLTNDDAGLGGGVGGNSTYRSFTALGGGGGAGHQAGISIAADNGGSGGGSTHEQQLRGNGSLGQGNIGGSGVIGFPYHGGGGGGAGSAGGTLTGGSGLANSITGSSVTYAAGGNGKGGESIPGNGANGAAGTGNGGDAGHPGGNDGGVGGRPAGGAGGSGTVIIRYEIAELSVSATSASAQEGTSNGEFTVSLSSALASSVVVSYSVGGTASAGADYTALSGTAVIDAGQTSTTISVPVIDDTTTETDESVIVSLSQVTQGPATIGANNTATVTISSEDGVQANADAAPSSAIIDQAGQFGTIAKFTHTYLQGRLNTAGAGDQAIILDKRRTDSDTLYDWVSFGLTNTQSQGALAGSGNFAFVQTGRDFGGEPDRSVAGFTLGAEYGDWTYTSETDIRKTGLSAGLYAGLGMGGISFTTNATLTRFYNAMTRTTGETATAQSTRLALSSGVNGIQTFGNGASLKPYADFLYAFESMEGYAYSDGTAFANSSADFGEVGVGIEFSTPPLSAGTFTLSGELEQTFGTEAITLSNGTTYTPNQSVTAEIGVGWTFTEGGATSNIDLTISEIGNEDTQEIRLDTRWSRNY